MFESVKSAAAPPQCAHSTPQRASSSVRAAANTAGAPVAPMVATRSRGNGIVSSPGLPDARGPRRSPRTVRAAAQAAKTGRSNNKTVRRTSVQKGQQAAKQRRAPLSLESTLGKEKTPSLDKRSTTPHKRTPVRTAFLVEYERGLASGKIARGKPPTETRRLEKKYKVDNAKEHYRKIKTQMAANGGRINRKKRGGDCMVLENGTPEAADAVRTLVQFAVAERYKFSYIEAADHMEEKGCGRGCSSKSLWRYIDAHWRVIPERAVPLLTAIQKSRRLKWSRKRSRESTRKRKLRVHLDEKWWYGVKLNVKCKVPPGHKRPRKPLQSKTMILVPKVMCVYVVGVPDEKAGFDGKIGFWRVCENYTAKRSSKYHDIGDVYEKDCTMDAAWYLKFVKGKVFKAMREKMPHKTGDTLVLQQDGASPQPGKKNVEALNRAGADTKRRAKGRQYTVAKCVVETQPPQSPDLNKNDLVVFPMLAAHFNKLQKQEKVGDLEAIARNARKVFKNFKPSKLLDAESFLSKIYGCVIDDEGGNDYEKPHRTAAQKRAGNQ